MDWDSTKGIMTALGIGLLIGAIRERNSAAPMAGLRTHALVAVVGAVSIHLGMGAYIAALLMIGALAVAGYMRNDPDDLGLTGEVALLVKLAALALFIIVTLPFFDAANFDPFMPNGFPRSGPSGKYGRCGMNMAPSGSPVRPRAHGQMPASARSSVDLPLPDGPCSSVCSPGATRAVAPCSKVAPVGSCSVRSAISIASELIAARACPSSAGA